MKLPDFSSGPLTSDCCTEPVPTSPRPAARGWKTGAVAFAPLAIAASAVLASCGGGGSSKPSSAAAGVTTTTTANGRISPAAMQAFLSCLSTHGVAVPTTVAGETTTTFARPPGTDATGQPRRRFGGGGGAGALFRYLGSTDPATQAAVKTCSGQLPPGVLQQFQQGQTARQAFVGCMKDHGVTVANAGGFGGAGPGPTSTTTPAYAAAFKVCSALLPQRGPGGAGGSPTTTA